MIIVAFQFAIHRQKSKEKKRRNNLALQIS
jgi:hypothetical protein